MIRRLRDAYAGAVAADRGALAFAKWFVIGLVLQALAMVPLLPFMLATLKLPEDVQPAAGGAVFLACFVLTRVFLFAIPCADVGRLKRRGARWAWLACGVLFGMFTLGVAAALEPRKAKA